MQVSSSRLSDQLSDYRSGSRRLLAHEAGPFSRVLCVLRGVPPFVHTEEVTGSNPVSPTDRTASQTALSE